VVILGRDGASGVAIESSWKDEPVEPARSEGKVEATTKRLVKFFDSSRVWGLVRFDWKKA
jgi:hypothetical protein